MRRYYRVQFKVWMQLSTALVLIFLFDLWSPANMFLRSAALEYYCFDSTDLEKKGMPLIAQLVGDVRDSTTDMLLGDVRVILKDEAGLVLESVATDDLEKFDLSIETNRKYILTVSHFLYYHKSFLIDPMLLEEVEGMINFPVLLVQKPGWGIYGKITDKSTGKPLSKVQIQVINKENTMKTTTSTNVYGEFLVDLNSNSSYELEFIKEGFFPLTAKFSSSEKNIGFYNLNEFCNLSLIRIEINSVFEIQYIYYESGSWEPNPEGKTQLDKLALFLKKNPMVKIELGSHTDSEGDKAENLTLSQKRANTAKNILISLGIDANRILAKGYGESKLKNHCADGVYCTEDQHKQNRRTEVRVLQK